MAKHVWTVLCSTSIIDAETNNLSLINALEQIGFIRSAGDTNSEPDIINLEMVLVTLWTRSDVNKPETNEGRTVVKDANGKTLWQKEYKINLKKSVRHRMRNLFKNINFSGVGRYRFAVQKKSPGGRWVQVADVPLEIYEVASGEAGSKTKH